MLWRKTQKADQKAQASTFRLLLWTAIAGLIFGLVGFGELPEDLLRASRNSLHWHKASGDIVVVTIDDRSLKQVGRWPWPRRYHAKIADALTQAGANRIFFDITFDTASDPLDDRLLEEALKRSGRVTLPLRALSGPDAGARPESMPLPRFAQHVELATVSVIYNYQSAVWRIPYAVDFDGRAVPSLAAKLAGVTRPPGNFFVPDYSTDPQSIPAVSASSVLSGRFDPTQFAGKDVVVGVTTDAIGDQMFIPGTGRMGAVYVQMIGGETLKSGVPITAGWIPAYLVALALAGLAACQRRALAQALVLGGLVSALLLVPLVLEANLIFVDIMPALCVALTVAAVLGWRGVRKRGLVNPVSGLPNLNALRVNPRGADQVLVAARILNYPEIAATLPADSERQLVELIVSRLSVGSTERTFYQGDGGIFAWFEEPRKAFGHHLEALYSLFRNPLRVADLSLDLSISFGVEIGSGRSLANRLGSALVAADEAAYAGLKWKVHDPETLQDASWKLSMLSQLDAAIDKGEVWIAYQPQLDLSSRRIIGAEALARWTHPEKGPIAASEFVAAAEQHDRIGKLTDFVLEKSIAAAAAINKRGYDFNIAVNLSAKLLTDRQFCIRVAAVLARHGLSARRLTLELTETAALAECGESIQALARLADLGITISIDDYGTGLSTLEYLKKIPADEIKIDQSFIKGLCDNRSDRLMVQSTIALAHSLGRKIVAEGVEHRETLDALLEMGCDIAQGFAVGRPSSLDSLLKRISSDQRRSVA